MSSTVTPPRPGSDRSARLAAAMFAAAVLGLASCAETSRDSRKQANERTAARVDSLVAAFQRTTYVPGLSVGVIRGGRDTLVLRGYGLADVKRGVPATASTVYPIASLTKQFTAAAVMKLVEERRLALDDSLGQHLPEMPHAWRGLQVRQLLNHTSGIPNRPVALPDDMAPDSVVAFAAGEPLAFEPGARWSYSNLGYIVLGLLIEEVSGESYTAYLERALLRPNGLTTTHECGARARATGYVQRDTTAFPLPRSTLRGWSAAGGLCSTAGDVAAWSHALAQGKVVTPASWTRMTTPEGAADGYGYGLIVQTVESRRFVGHGGQLAGFRSSSAYLPDDSLAVAVLSNLATETVTPLLLAIARAALPASERTLPPRH